MPGRKVQAKHNLVFKKEWTKVCQLLRKCREMAAQPLLQLAKVKLKLAPSSAMSTLRSDSPCQPAAVKIWSHTCTLFVTAASASSVCEDLRLDDVGQGKWTCTLQNAKCNLRPVEAGKQNAVVCIAASRTFAGNNTDRQSLQTLSHCSFCSLSKSLKMLHSNSLGRLWLRVRCIISLRRWTNLAGLLAFHRASCEALKNSGSSDQDNADATAHSCLLKFGWRTQLESRNNSNAHAADRSNAY